MMDVIKNLLALQDRDRKLMRVREELARVAPERQTLTTSATSAQARLDAARLQSKHIESDRKKLELDVEAQKQLIEKYSLQQFQTRKNEEYRALSHEIDQCKANISGLEDQILTLMEKADATQKEINVITQENQATKKLVDGKLGELASREEQLKNDLMSLEGGRAELASAVDDPVRNRYERLLKSKGNNVIVGIHHGVCGGCHMTLQRQVIVSCQADQEVVPCPNCGRILYFTSDMDTVAAE